MGGRGVLSKKRDVKGSGRCQGPDHYFKKGRKGGEDVFHPKEGVEERGRREGATALPGARKGGKWGGLCVLKCLGEKGFSRVIRGN